MLHPFRVHRTTVSILPRISCGAIQIQSLQDCEARVILPEKSKLQLIEYFRQKADYEVVKCESAMDEIHGNNN